MDKKTQKRLYGWLRNQSSHGRRWIGLSIGFGLGQGILMVAQAWLLATLLHGFIIEGATPEQSIPLFITLLLVTLIKATLAYGREVASFKAGSAVRQAIRELVLTRLSRLGPAYIQRRPAGSWASLLLEQIENMQDFFSRYLPQMAIAVFIPLVILVAVFPVNWAAGLILLGTAPLIPFFMILVGVGAADANRRNFQALARLSGHFLDRLKGLRTLQLFMRTRAEGDAIRDASEDFRERTMEVLRLAFLSTAVLEFFAALSVALVAVYFGFSYIDHLNFGHYGTKVTLFTGLFVLFLAPEFYAPLRELGANYHAKAQAIGAAEQLLEFLEAEVSEPASGNASFHADSPVKVEARALEVLSAEGKVLVGPIDFTLAAGSRTALIGISGAGKSSLVNALLGFAPYRGELKVNWQELASLDMSQWRLQLGWLSQNPQLFHASLRDNLLLAKPSASDAELEDALKRAQAWEFAMEKGLDYPVGDQAGGLSVGQAQRLALARTLLKSTQLMVLDEPTASLDRHSERAIMTTLEQATAGQTLLMITHRLDELTKMDNILVLARGQLVEQGGFQQLSQAQGAFANLLSHRSGSSLDD
ncbi:cysteine/glutathione ABC transporter permease/ATP-binding protein CydD [Aeromonas salmonicida subsp. achromogenes]|uniref:heme ABC transporter permease/ATP-binding protein CydD n=1 Tax=Aeromonas salmonicida TaxID=645 RepID=UPI0002EA43D3|nr:cysteine/glutathione ABC transporter permease/ATP-binding protein CydD [Aeromonas salmonicida]TMX11570.1 cysteine/glutathione ABC transporter permease/ATP-binding protein CydD [Aeromonas salmonicida subsp. achromogenes]TMX14738.1 cysteine/glutathione ABC transporter permease/ATP-binding protein CydD [Aeromonas salmonicida subsp. achromogenes]TMX15084.1 cysteine/glutathione ABC transporter permease/ATP-binding protein CydD [Aeromonas salmonicida subsp. achromogenes]TMX20165.1 cysteine/glutath